MPVNNTRVFPYSACVFLVVEYHNGETMCGSGSMITPTKVLTAGHMLYDKQHGYGYAKKIRVCPAHNNSGSPFGENITTAYSIYPGWENSNPWDISKDIGIITLTQPLGTETGIFDLSLDVNSYSSITISGYPDKANGHKVSGQLWTMAGKISNLKISTIDYQVDMTHGQSGAGVYLSNTDRIVGVNSSEYPPLFKNSAVRINSTKLNWIKKQMEKHNSVKPVYRLYNRNTGEHFYTKNINEVNILKNAGWNYENIAWLSVDSGASVYRLRNPNTGDHFYTADASEKNYLVSLGWVFEEIGWKSALNYNVPVYRLYNPNATGAGAHHFTMSENERNDLIACGWNDEGIGFYASK